MKTETVVTKDGKSALKIPVFNGSYNNEHKKNTGELLEPEVQRNSILEKMFSAEELSSLMIVKADKSKPDPKHLRGRKFEDGIRRSLMFSSGGSHYFGDEKLKTKIQKLFETEPDSACRYGSLLASNCMEGCRKLKADRPIRVKIVDFTDEKYAKYKTGDCHGKISPKLAKQIGGESDRAMQFRFGWRTEWNKDNNPKSPQTSFIAKGTLLPDSSLTTEIGCDIILDRSSVKGLNKKLLKTGKLLPCGDYELPSLVLGNRENSQVGDYSNSWQLTGVWYSEKALRKDIVPETIKEAQKLAEVQKDPIKLNKYLVEQYDKQQEFKRQQEEQTGVVDSNDDNNSDENKNTASVIEIVRNDTAGLLAMHPNIDRWRKRMVANKWKDLAINGGVSLSSGMTLPCPELPRGTICAEHLPDGEDIFMSRYPVLNKDNNRIYTNEHRPELTKYKGVIWVNPEDFEEFHQGDFDGDKAAVKAAKEIPNIAKETLRAGKDADYDFIQVIQADKVPYTEAVDKKGNKKYDTMEKIAVASSQQKVGIVAINIGKVASAVPNENEDKDLFKEQQKKLIIGLSIMEQYEVDYQKNSLRGEDAKEIKKHTGIDAKNLLAAAKEFGETHPSLLFDFKNDERLYRTFPLPDRDPNPINVIAREAVNPYWEEIQSQPRPRHEFTEFMPEPENSLEWEESETVEWAKNLKDRTREAIGEISERTGKDKKAFKEELGVLYENLRAEIDELYPTKEEKLDAATAVYRITHTPVNTKHRNIGNKIAEEYLETAFFTTPSYELLHEAIPRETYVLQVPFIKLEEDTQIVISDKFEERLNEKGYKEGKHYQKQGDELIFPEKYGENFANSWVKFEERKQTIDAPNYWKEQLDEIGIKYEAIAHETLPLVEFALKIHPKEKTEEHIVKFLNELKDDYGDNDNIDIDPSVLEIRDRYNKCERLIVMPPASCPWIEPREEQGAASLAFSLFPEEIIERVKTFKIEEIVAANITNTKNAFKDENFNSNKWAEKEVTITVGTIDLPKDDRHYIRFQGTPILQIDGQNLGTFAPESPKLPVGSTFKATIETDTENKSKLKLKVVPGSLRTVATDLDTEESQTKEPMQPRNSKESETEKIVKSSNETEKFYPLQPKQEKTYQDKLISDIAKIYQSIKTPDKLTTIPLDIDDWTAYVGKTGTCVIITSDKTPIYKGNIQTGKTAQELSDENLSKLIKNKAKAIEPDRLSTGNGNHKTTYQETTQDEYNALLISSLKDHYKLIPNPNSLEKINLGIADWTAYIKEDGRCVITTENREPIFKGNIKTGKITEGLNEDSVNQMEEEMVKYSRNCEKKQHNGNPKMTSKKLDISIE